MYSRTESGRNAESYRIPDNYHGNAFRPQPTPEPPQITEASIPDPPTHETTEAEIIPVIKESPKQESHSWLSSLLPPKPSGLSGFFGNIGLEELLILGIILLLSGSETDDDILLLLILLLFYK